MKHIDGYFDHGSPGTFTAAGLQQPQLTVLYGKLEVLHVFEVVFKFLLRFNQFFGTFGQCLFE
ncbi:hypothetical protein SDC9_83304 [bioreactor metagenome]|uniref:Uncharacterized protein n=1 Tax=bioreactor metagenome TaxID=1076179 RepID=A0A644Z7C2_9ZZZZ